MGENNKPNSNAPRDTLFLQQKLKGWKPKITIGRTLFVYGLFSFISLFIGSAVIVSMGNVKEKAYDYTNKVDKLTSQNAVTEDCFPNTKCTLDFNFTLTEDWNTEVLIMQQLMDFQANHRKFILSRSWKQLSGDYKYDTLEKLKNTCSGVSKQENLQDWQKDLLDKNQKEYAKENNITYNKLDRNDTNVKNSIAVPCGLAAKQMFFDKYDLFKIEDGKKVPVNLTYDKLVWDSYTPNKTGFPQNSPKDWKQYAWIKTDSQRFISWMITPGRNDFRKIYAKIPKLAQGEQSLKIWHHTDVKLFGAHKSVVVTTQNVFGAKNNFLGIIFIILGVLSALVIPCFIVKQQKIDKVIEEKEGDEKDEDDKEEEEDKKHFTVIN